MSIEMVKNGKKLYRHRQLLFGAAGGMIRVFDERDGTTTSVPVDEFQARADALGREAARCVYPSERKALTDAAVEMAAAAAEAAAQGDPFDPRVQAYYARHRPQNTVLVGPGTTPLAGPR